MKVLKVVYLDGKKETIDCIESFYTTSQFLIFDRGSLGRSTILLSALRGWTVP